MVKGVGAGTMFQTFVKGQWLKALLAIAVAQAAYWLVVNPLLFVPTPPPEKLPVSDVFVAELKSPDLAGFATAAFKPVTLPWDGCCEPGYRAVRMSFTLPAIPADGLGVVPLLGSDNYRMYVNGILLLGDGEMRLPRSATTAICDGHTASPSPC
jgi:two-component system, NarL family, sensor histidine kinase UhpB